MADADSSRKIESLARADSSPNWEQDSLGFLIAPVDRDNFFERHYEQSALINIRNEPARYSDLLTIEALDHFIASADLQEGMIDLTNHRNRITRDAFIDDRGNISRAVVTEEYMNGATIILPQLHDSMFNLSEFCRSLEEIFSCHVQTNIYLTPESVDEEGNQGFPPHYDNHDVFVMQVAGAKSWQLYGTPVEIPYRGEGFELGRHEAGEVTEQFTLKPGDCLYLPRGLMHDARNVGSEPSLHITVGLITKTWADLLLEAISELALTEPGFRRSLPAGFAARDFDREAAREHFDSLTQAIAEKAQMDGAFDLLADNFIRARRPNVAGVIASGAPTSDDKASYRRRRFLPWNVADDEGKLVIIAPGGDLIFSAEDGDALDIALSGKPFQLSELQCADPTAMLRRLWAAGFLERVSG